MIPQTVQEKIVRLSIYTVSINVLLSYIVGNGFPAARRARIIRSISITFRPPLPKQTTNLYFKMLHLHHDHCNNVVTAKTWSNLRSERGSG